MVASALACFAVCIAALLMAVQVLLTGESRPCREGCQGHESKTEQSAHGLPMSEDLMSMDRSSLDRF